MSVLLLLFMAFAFGLPILVAIGAIGGMTLARPGQAGTWAIWVGVPGAAVAAATLLGMLPGIGFMVAYGTGAFGGPGGPVARELPSLFGMIGMGGATNGVLAGGAYVAVAGMASFLPAMRERAPWLRGSLGPAALMTGAFLVVAVGVFVLLRVVQPLD